MKTRILRTLALGACAAPLLFMAAGAEAHARLVKASPAANAVVHAPAAVHLQFSERLEPKFSGVDLMSASGAIVASTAKVSAKIIDVTPKAALAPGAYMAMWHAVAADDGHKTQGSFNFTVK